ncbi:ComEC/Rec2 family competence protein [Pseudorhodobacter sp. W20_MBD10_FR17]|uniref:ComEC/Rec2 family competence protein n=1 Tax=Pseudorhodobacter sp. W20_MBD10_FR17 TaxID=3240266 RepID=UPI003F9BF7C3
MPFIALAQAFETARGRLFPWVPVLMGIGVGLWFSLPMEPEGWHYASLVFALLVAVLCYRIGPELLHPVLIAFMCVMLGMLAAGARAHLVEAPVLGFRYYGAVQGRVVMIDRSQSDMVRLTLDQVVLARVSPNRTPARVRISLHGQQGYVALRPGQVVVTTAHLSAPEGPVEPGGFDFRRMAFFDRLGAVGYTRVPVLLLAPPAARSQWINRLRAQISASVEARVAGDAGGFAAALVTGDRAGISRTAQDDLRAANLAHLLAISGLHMALLTGFIFATLRYGLALVQVLALRVNSKKLAAALALAAGAVYLLLSGGNVATERAFVMVAVMLGAVLFDRRALSIRSVALAACVLLLAQPETLLEPGFQMSFAATVALIAGYGALRGRKRPERVPGWIMPLLAVVFTSLLAGLATAPIAAAHFNRVSGYGLIANVLAVPVMGTAVMPAAVLAGVLAPFGLEGPALWVMGKGTAWILWVANTVAGWDGSVNAVVSPPWFVLPVMALAALWVILWRGPLRFAGLAPLAFAFGMWGLTDRPPVLISDDGNLIGLATREGRALSAPKGAGFSAKQWLENDGEMVDQMTAAARKGFEGPAKARQFELAGWKIIQLKGKGAEVAVSEACTKADLVILSAKPLGVYPIGCSVIDEQMLRATGALALWPHENGEMRVSQTETQMRLWTGQNRAPTQLVLPMRVRPVKLNLEDQ